WASRRICAPCRLGGGVHGHARQGAQDHARPEAGATPAVTRPAAGFSRRAADNGGAHFVPFGGETCRAPKRHPPKTPQTTYGTVRLPSPRGGERAFAAGEQSLIRCFVTSMAPPPRTDSSSK